jgi:hypothetical protein
MSADMGEAEPCVIGMLSAKAAAGFASESTTKQRKQESLRFNANRKDS